MGMYCPCYRQQSVVYYLLFGQFYDYPQKAVWHSSRLGRHSAAILGKGTTMISIFGIIILLALIMLAVVAIGVVVLVVVLARKKEGTTEQPVRGAQIQEMSNSD